MTDLTENRGGKTAVTETEEIEKRRLACGREIISVDSNCIT